VLRRRHDAPVSPTPDRLAGKAVGAALRRLGYSEDGLFRLLGDEAYSGGREEVPIHERRLSDSRLATAVRLFFLERPVPFLDAVRALGRRTVDALETTGLADLGDDVAPRARITPVGELLVASDGYSRDVQDPPDYVATYTPTSRLCDLLTPRPHVARALDLGTGNGIHALRAAQHSRHVVATDVNERALAYTELNAALNGLANVECRRGSLFEPVGDERFELITCNAPFVVSPERRWAYRDGGFEADGFSEHIVRGAADHLAEGGFATLLVSWIADDEDALDEHALGWVEETGCDGWILPVFGSEPLDHAAGWNAHLAADPDAYGTAVDEWTRYLDDLGVRWVSEGAVLLHKRPGARRPVRVDEVDEDELDEAGDQVLRAFATRARLAEPGRAELLEGRPAPAARLVVENELGAPPSREILVRLDEGTHHAFEAPARAAAVVAALDGRVSLGDAIQAVADRLSLSAGQASRLRREAVDLTRALLEIGALELSY